MCSATPQSAALGVHETWLKEKIGDSERHDYLDYLDYLPRWCIVLSLAMDRVPQGHVKVHRLLAMQKAAPLMQGIFAAGSLRCNPKLKGRQTSASCGSRSRSCLNQATADKFFGFLISFLTCSHNRFPQRTGLEQPPDNPSAISGKARTSRVSEDLNVFLNGPKETSMMAMSAAGKTSPKSL